MAPLVPQPHAGHAGGAGSGGGGEEGPAPCVPGPLCSGNPEAAPQPSGASALAPGLWALPASAVPSSPPASPPSVTAGRRRDRVSFPERCPRPGRSGPPPGEHSTARPSGRCPRPSPGFAFPAAGEWVVAPALGAHHLGGELARKSWGHTGGVEGAAGNPTLQCPEQLAAGEGDGARASRGTLTVQEMQYWGAGVRTRSAFYSEPPLVH